ncbi:MAG: hypothetical protein ACREU0_06615 [Burkholderiales bacterium]
MKSKAVMKPKSLLIACCAATALAFLIGVVDDSYAQRGGGGKRGGGGFSRGGGASSGSFSDAAAGPAGAGRAGVGGQAGVGGGAAGQAGVGGGAAGAAGVGAAARTTPVVVLPCSATVMTINGVTYYRCGTTYYTQSYSGGSVVYVPSAPPPGY